MTTEDTALGISEQQLKEIQKEQSKFRKKRFSIRISLDHFIIALLIILLLWLSESYIYFIYWSIMAIPICLVLLKIFHQNFIKMEYYFFKKLSKFTQLHHYLLWQIQWYSKKQIFWLIEKRAFHLLFRLSWENLELLFRILVNNPKYNRFICPTAKELLRKCAEEKYSIFSMAQLLRFYEVPTYRLLEKLIRKKELTDGEIERIIYETTGDERIYLEKHLSPDDPILQQIHNLERIKISDEYTILK